MITRQRCRSAGTRAAARARHQKIRCSAMLQTIKTCWSDFCIVAASGPSLTPKVADACKGFHVVAVNDAYRLFPDADVLYACDPKWWDVHKGVRKFAGER